MKDYKEKFKNPERQYGIYPIFHAGIAGIRDSSEKIDLIAQRGFAGVVGNTPYRNRRDYPNVVEEWDDTEYGFRYCFSKGMKAWIYDEKGYPSGNAGGVVIEKNLDHPEFQAVGLYCYEHVGNLVGPNEYRADIPEGSFESALLVPIDGEEAIDISDTINENGTLYFDIPKGSYRFFILCSRRLFDGTHAAESFSEPRNYVNLCDAGATKEFIRVTHEKYAERLSDEFGKGVRAFFTDEPSLISWNIRTGVYPILPWHRDFPADFKKEYGYDIQKAAIAVVANTGPEKAKRRCDFWDFVSNKVSENYFGVIQDWCHEHGTLSSGHMLREETLQCHIYCYGSLHRCAKRMDIPGIDQLTSDPNSLMNKNAIPIARLLGSAADVYGIGEAFTEFSDYGQRNSHRQVGVKWIKDSVNWHMAMGINNMVSYYNFSPFSDEEMLDLNAYTARVGYMLRKGKRYSRTALLYPENSMWSAYTPTVERGALDPSEEIMTVQNTFVKASWQLLERQVDFDYIDEKLIADGVIKNGALEYNDRRYESIVFPACNVLSKTTVEKLVQMMKAGIKVVFLGDLPKIARETGSDGGFYDILSPYLSTEELTVVPLTSTWSLPSRFKSNAIPRTIVLKEYSPKVYSDGEPISDYMLAHTRILDNGDLLVFVANMNCNPYEGEISIENAISADRLCTDDGSVVDAEMVSKDGIGVASIALPAYDSVIFHVKMSK